MSENTKGSGGSDKTNTSKDWIGKCLTRICLHPKVNLLLFWAFDSLVTDEESGHQLSPGDDLQTAHHLLLFLWCKPSGAAAILNIFHHGGIFTVLCSILYLSALSEGILQSGSPFTEG